MLLNILQRTGQPPPKSRIREDPASNINGAEPEKLWDQRHSRGETQTGRVWEEAEERLAARQPLTPPCPAAPAAVCGRSASRSAPGPVSLISL